MSKLHPTVLTCRFVLALSLLVASSIPFHAAAQATPQTAGHKQLDRIDFAISSARTAFRSPFPPFPPIASPTTARHSSVSTTT